MALSAPNAVAPGGEAINFLLSLLFDNFSTVNSVRLVASAALKEHGVRLELEFIPSAAIGVGQINLCSNPAGDHCETSKLMSKHERGQNADVPACVAPVSSTEQQGQGMGNLRSSSLTRM